MKRVEFLSNPLEADALFAEALAMIVSGNYTAEQAKVVAHQALYQNSLARNRERLLNQWTQAYSEDFEKWKSTTQVLECECLVIENALCQLDEKWNPATIGVLNARLKRLRDGIEDLNRIHRNFLHSMVSSIGEDEALKIRQAVE